MIQYRHTLPILMKELGLPLIGAEIGCAEGYNAFDLLNNGLEKLFMIDIWESHPERYGDIGMPAEWHDKNYNDAMNRIEPFKDRVTVLRGFAADMAYKIPDESLGLVYLDADHSESGVLLDLKTYYPKLVKGGIMAGHDVLNENFGVGRALARWLFDDPSRMKIIPENGDPNNASFYFIK